MTFSRSLGCHVYYYTVGVICSALHRTRVSVVFEEGLAIGSVDRCPKYPTIRTLAAEEAPLLHASAF
jgi:hypothetical protein